MLKFFVLVLIGRLLLHLIQKFPLPRFLNEWQSCLLCSGAWVYTLLLGIFRVDFLSTIFYDYQLGYVPFVNEVITGATVSWLMYIFEIGFKENYLNVTILE